MEILIKPDKNQSSISKPQIITLVIVLVLAGGFFLNRQFGWFGATRHEPIIIPSGTPYAEATVIGAYEGVVLAERVGAAVDAKGNALPKKMEILTGEKTVFAKITSSGPVKISRDELFEGDVVWVYRRVPSLAETLANPAGPNLAISSEEMLKNPREKISAEFIVLIGE